MKKTILFCIFALCCMTAYSQLKVTPDGKVAVGIGISETPISNFTIGTVGEQYIRNMIQGDIVTLYVKGLSNSPYEVGYWGLGIQVTSEVNSMRGDKGIECTIQKPSPSSSGRAIGITAMAANATGGYNYGVIGALGGSNNGTGILGTSFGNYQGFYIDGKYAGYFEGDVKVTGVINGIVVGTSDARYKQNVEEFSKSSVLSNIVRLNPISYNYRQVYLEPASDTLKVQRGLFDERSPMFQKKHFGLIAQDLQQIYPDLVYEDDNGYLSVNYTELIPLLIQSIKELKAEVDQLSASAVNVRSTTANGVVSDMTDISTAVLYQNAPNPFSERTEIKFRLPEKFAHASIMLFNMQGALLKQYPVNRQQQSIIIHGAELIAGMYLYSLVIDGNEIDTKRMILTK